MADVLNHKCPGCGSPLRFDSSSQMLHCDSCGADLDVETVSQYDSEAENIEDGDSATWQNYDGQSWDHDNVNVHVCPSCGAEIVTEPTTAVTKCPYCDNVTVIGGKLSGAFRPDYVIPFRVSVDEARMCMENFCRKKPLLPRNFIEELHLESTQGLYVPFWLFDCAANARMTFIGTKVRHWSDNRYNYTETSRFRVFRRGEMAFSKIPVDGSQKADDTLMDSIEPFDYNALSEFGTGYLSGFIADKYDVDAAESRPRANARVKHSIEAALAATVIGYSSVVPTSSAVNIADGTVKYALLPVWMLHYNYHGKRFTYAINGQTGKTVGKLPISRGKVAMWSGIVYASAAAAIAALLAFVNFVAPLL